MSAIKGRRGVHASPDSPPNSQVSPPSPPRTRSTKQPSSTPTKPTTSKPHPENSSEDGEGEDEVDKTSQHSPSLYPDLGHFTDPSGSSSPEKSPATRSDPGLPADPSRSQCRERVGITSSRVVVSRSAEDRRTGRRLLPEDRRTGRILLPEDRARQRYRGTSPLFKIFLISLVIIGIWSLYYNIEKTREIQAQEKQKKRSITEVYENLKLDLKYINQLFSQPKQFWQQLLGQLESVMVEDPRQPGVVLVVVPEDAYGTATCLIHGIAKAITNAFQDTNFVMYDASSETAQDPSNFKYELDSTLRGLQSSHAAIIHHIEAIPGSSAMIFHAYCDNENAPFKQAVLFPLIRVEGRYEEVSQQRLDVVVDDLLTQLWQKQLQEKDASAIVSRIANAPVLIKPEPLVRLKVACPNQYIEQYT